MTNRMYKQIVESMESQLKTIEKRFIDGELTYRESIREKNMQMLRIEYFKKGFNLSESESSKQVKLG